LCKVGEDSVQHLFFKCIFARVVCRHSFWPLGSTTLNFPNILDWIKVIISPGTTLKIPKGDHHCFQIFVAVTCDLLWSYRNKAYHDGLSFDALPMSRNTNKVAFEHIMAWKHLSNTLVEEWIPPDAGREENKCHLVLSKLLVFVCNSIMGLPIVSHLSLSYLSI